MYELKRPDFSYVDSYSENLEEISFVYDYKEDQICIANKIVVEENPVSILRQLKSKFDINANIKSRNSESVILYGNDFFIKFTFPCSQWNKTIRQSFDYTIYATPELSVDINEAIQVYKINTASLRFFFSTSGRKGGDVRHFDATLPAGPIYYPEYYPWIPTDYLDRYMDHSAAILLLFGATGTGKTSVIRQLLTDKHLKAIVVYDEAVIRDESIFIDFLSSDYYDIMILEDCDELLKSRTKDKNDIIVKILNYSEGLLKFPNKKIIFTTNLHDFDDVDEALIRPGRCFGSIVARELNYEESQKVISLAKNGKKLEEKSYTIAELLSDGGATINNYNLMGFKPQRTSFRIGK
jgi:hypothetical protein